MFWHRGSCSDPEPEPPDVPTDPDAVCPDRYRNNTPLPVVECAAVVAVFQSVYGADWQHPSTDLCGGNGGVGRIVCTGRRVVRLRMNRAPAGAVVPADIANLAALEWIDGENGELTGLPDEINELAELRTLWLRNGQISSLPADLSGLVNLSTLNLEENPLGSIPAGVSTLAGLETLDLSDAEITVLDPAVLGQLAVVDLDLGYNDMVSIPDAISDAQIVRLNCAYLGTAGDQP